MKVHEKVVEVLVNYFKKVAKISALMNEGDQTVFHWN